MYYIRWLLKRGLPLSRVQNCVIDYVPYRREVLYGTNTKGGVMRKILLAICIFLSMIVCLTSAGWTGVADDVRTGFEAARRGDHATAIRFLTRAIDSGELSSDQLMALYTLRGISWKSTGEYAKALADFDKAIELDSQCVPAYNELAWIMATCPDGQYRNGKRAVELAETALKLPKGGLGVETLLDTLAAAYAEEGRFQDAIETQERAIKLLNQKGATKEREAMMKHLSSYQAGKPWREK